MKLHLLTATVLATLASTTALAANEGGDTWSEVQSLQPSSFPVAQSAPRGFPALALDAAASEGGDTWSSVQALQETRGEQVAQSGPARSDTDYARVDPGSEGGDTWSRFVPQFQGEPMASTGLASESPVQQPN